MKEIRIAVMISWTGTNLRAILGAISDGDVDGKVVVVGTDNPNAPGLNFAWDEKVPTFTVDYGEICEDLMSGRRDIPSDVDVFNLEGKGWERFTRSNIYSLLARLIAEQEILEKMKEYRVDLLVLAGYMKMLTPYFVQKFSPDPLHPRIMNIHPALSPAFPGTDGYGDTFRYGCKVGGCTVFFVDEGEDTGAIIGQKAYDIIPGETLDDIKSKGLANEWLLFPYCIQLFAAERLKVVVRDGRKIVEILPSRYEI